MFNKSYNELIRQKEDGTYDEMSKDEQREFRSKFRQINFSKTTNRR